METVPPSISLSRSSLVPRELVHRSAPSGVLLTDVDRAGPNQFVAAAHWPRSHPTFDRSGDGRHHPLMVAETLRQLGLYLPLGYYGVSQDWHLLIDDLRFVIDSQTEPLASYAGTDITCRFELEHTRFDGRGVLRAFGIRVCFLAAATMFAVAEGHASVIPDAAYAAIRRRTGAAGGDRSAGDIVTPPLRRPAPESVGVPQPSDVLIAVDSLGAVRLHPADPLHPFYFDHASDHLPGMCLAEGCRQAAALLYELPGFRMVEFEIEMPHFTELSPPPVIDCSRTGARYSAEVRQGGVCTVSARLTPDAAGSPARHVVQRLASSG